MDGGPRGEDAGASRGEIPALPLSPGERTERDEGSTETALDAARGERRALAWAAIAAVAAIVWLVLPVGVGILLGTLLAFALQPAFERLKPRLGVGWSAPAVVVATLLALGSVVGGLAWLLVSEGTALTGGWIASLGPGGPGHAVVTAVGRVTSRMGLPPDELAARARELAESVATGATAVAAAIVSTAAAAEVSQETFTMERAVAPNDGATPEAIAAAMAAAFADSVQHVVTRVMAALTSETPR